MNAARFWRPTSTRHAPQGPPPRGPFHLVRILWLSGPIAAKALRAQQLARRPARQAPADCEPVLTDVNPRFVDKSLPRPHKSAPLPKGCGIVNPAAKGARACRDIVSTVRARTPGAVRGHFPTPIYAVSAMVGSSLWKSQACFNGCCASPDRSAPFPSRRMKIRGLVRDPAQERCDRWIISDRIRIVRQPRQFCICETGMKRSVADRMHFHRQASAPTFRHWVMFLHPPPKGTRT